MANNMKKLDPDTRIELSALRSIVLAMDKLDVEQRARVACYIIDRFVTHPPHPPTKVESHAKDNNEQDIC
jgi:hypothetical protein